MNLSNLDIKTFPTISQKQILLDWVNTINEPQCLLVSESKDLLNGDVFVEILIHFLYITNNKEMLTNLQNENINSEIPEIKLQIVLDYFLQVCNDDTEYQTILNKLKQMSKTVVDSEELLIETLALFRKIFEKFNIVEIYDMENNESVINNQEVICNRNNRKKSELNTIQELMEPPNTNSLSIRNSLITKNDNDKEMNKSKKEKCRKHQICDNKIKKDNYNYVQNKSEYDDELNNYSLGKRMLTNSDKVNKSCSNSYGNSKYKSAPRSKSQHKNKMSHSVRNPPYEINLTNGKQFESNSPLITNNYNDKNKKIPISLDNSDLNYSKIYNNTPMYSKCNKSIINMTRGLIQTNKNIFCIDYPFPRMKYIKFLKLTDPIINCNYKTIHKYKIISSINAYTSPQIEISSPKQQKQTYKGFYSNKNEYQLTKVHTKDKQNNHNPTPKERKILSMSPLNTHTNTKFNLSYPTNNSYYYSTLENSDIKNKIYNWIIYLNIIKQDIITMEHLPSMCTNGVLLSDIINRCEGRFPIVKGITRNPCNQTQIRTNINKVLSYLESIEKFSSKYLWSVNEIMEGSSHIIWGLLSDIYIYYTKEQSYFVNTLSKSKQKYEQSNMKQPPEVKLTLNNNFQNQNESPYHYTNPNKNQINHITNKNEESDMLMVYMNKKTSHNKSNPHSNRLMNVEYSEIPHKLNNNSNFLSERERNNIKNMKQNKNKKVGNSTNNSVNNIISCFETDLPNKKRFLLFDNKPFTTSKNKLKH